MTVRELREKYREVFGEESQSNHRQFLIRRIAWRIQELAEGGLSERARQRALEIANDADLRIRAPKNFLKAEGDDAARTVLSKLQGHKDERLPMPGTELTREYRGQRIVVRVLPDGFEYDGRRFRSLSAIASKVTGVRWNGFLFFGLNGGKEEQRADS
jgi:hypothetical protein